MTNWLSELDDHEQRSVDEMNKNGLSRQPQKQKQPGLFDGALSAVPRGVAAGTAKALDVVFKPVDAIADRIAYAQKDFDSDEIIEPYAEFQAQKKKERTRLVLDTVEHLEDAKNTGTVGHIGFGISDFATRNLMGSAVGGIPGAVGLTAASESNYVYQDLQDKGVDSTTAAKVAVTDGAVAGVSAALPISYGLKGTGGLLKDAALSVGGATALSTGGQYASGQILKSENYDKQAKKYEITAESLSTDASLNALLFLVSRGAVAYKSKVDADVAAELKRMAADDVEAHETQVQSALVLNEAEFDNAASPVKTSDPVQQNNHYKNMNIAQGQIIRGHPVNVPHAVKGEEQSKTIDYESMSLPSNAKLIAQKARQDGVDPGVALTISHIETGGSFSHTAQNPTSSAHGLFQILNKTWKGQGGGDRNSIDEQIKQGLKHIKNANASMRKSLGRDPVASEQYLGHLLGPAGAAKILKADPDAKLIDVVRKYDAKNANNIVNNNGMKGLTVGEAISKWRNKWNSLSARYGGNGTSTATGMDGSSYEFAYEVKSLSDLIASNDQAYGINPNYPMELQPRDRTREASRQQIENMANDLKPEWLGESAYLSNGAPIIGLDNVVESGNGRTLAIGKAYADGKAEAYQQFVNDYASSRGLDISGLNQPVLVRTRLTDTDRVQFTRLANEADIAQYSATERARSDTDRLPDSSMLKINNDGTLNLDQSMDYVRAFVDQLPAAERGQMVTGDGRLSQDGKRRLETALVSHAYDDAGLVARLSENIDDDSKTVLNALLKAAPQLSQLNDLVKQGGRHQNSIAADLAQAAQKLSDIKASGQTVPDYLNQMQLLDDGLSPGAKQFLNVFDNNKRSAKAISENIQSEIDRIENMGDPRQGSLFGDDPEGMAAMDIILKNPDQDISVPVSIRPDGEVESITMTLSDYLKRMEDEVKQSKEDTLAAQTAISCALQFGM